MTSFLPSPQRRDHEARVIAEFQRLGLTDETGLGKLREGLAMFRAAPGDDGDVLADKAEAETASLTALRGMLRHATDTLHETPAADEAEPQTAAWIAGDLCEKLSPS